MCIRDSEELVAAFTAGALPFLGITDLLERMLETADQWSAEPTTVADVLAAEDWARTRARELAHRSGVIRT